MKWRPRRRPVWQPSRLSRIAHFLGGLLKQLTFKRVALALFVLPLLLYVYREVTRDSLVIDPFSVPKQYEEAGLTPEVVANRIGNAMRQIEAEARTEMKKDNLESIHDEGSTPDVEIPGTKLGLKTLVDITRAVFGVYPKHVSGDIVAQAATDPSSKPEVKVTVYLTQGRRRSLAFDLVADANNIDSLAKATAERILGQVNPYILAEHRYAYATDQGQEAAEILQGIIQDSSEDQKHVLAALDLLGTVLRDHQQYDEAVLEYQKAIKLNPKYAAAHVGLGIVLEDRHKQDEAVVEYQKAIKLDPKHAAAYYNLGKARYFQHKYDDAILEYQKAIKLNPKYASAYYWWGLALSEKGKPDEAKEKFAKARELSMQAIAAESRIFP
jgi:tetratricopeptide (TPR) repeat protein